MAAFERHRISFVYYSAWRQNGRTTCIVAMNLFILIGTNAYWLRRQAGLTQDEVAARMGISHSHYSKIENGRQNLTFGTFDRLYKALDVRPAALFEEGRAPKPMRASPSTSGRTKN